MVRDSKEFGRRIRETNGSVAFRRNKKFHNGQVLEFWVNGVSWEEVKKKGRTKKCTKRGRRLLSQFRGSNIMFQDGNGVRKAVSRMRVMDH
jgi:hypothetical protein